MSRNKRKSLSDSKAKTKMGTKNKMISPVHISYTPNFEVGI